MVSVTFLSLDLTSLGINAALNQYAHALGDVDGCGGMPVCLSTDEEVLAEYIGVEGRLKAGRRLFKYFSI